MNEEQLKKELIAKVQEFAIKRDKIENYVREQSELQDASLPKFATDEEKWKWLKENPQTNWFREFEKELAPIFDEYCTDKNRVYGGKNVYCFGFPTKFDGIENYIDASVELKNKNRAEVYFKTESDFEDEYLFVVLRKNDTWKIDSYKNRCYGDEKWDNKIL